MRISALLCLLLTCSFGFAQDRFPAIRGPGRPDSPLRPKTGVDAMSHLTSLGFVDSAVMMHGPASRYRSATFAFGYWSQLKGILGYLEHGDKSGEAAFIALGLREKELPAAAIEIRYLLDEFRAELTKLGADVDKVKADCDTFPLRFETALTTRYFGHHRPPPASPQWAIDTAHKLASQGWLVGFPDERPMPPSNPYVIAVVAHAVFANLVQTVSDAEKRADAFAAGDPKFSSAEKDIRADAGLLWKAAPVEGDLYKLIELTYYELVKLGADPQDMISRIDDAFSRIAEFRVPTFGSFSDIPRSHWAATAANELKRAGILVGDGKGHFGGS